MTARAYVLLSGGVDSTTCLHIAAEQFPEVVGVSVNYGQRHRKEIECARLSCADLCAEHREVDISAVVPRTMLTDPDAEVPDVSYDEIEGVSPTYVPFRNGLLLSTVASLIAGERAAAEDALMFDAIGEWALFFGAHAEDAQRWAYPDCTPEFIGAMANAIYIGTYRQVRLHTPLEWCGKAEIVRWGDRLEVDWRKTWSCYRGEEYHCGTCPTCRARKEGFKLAGVADPTEYVVP